MKVTVHQPNFLPYLGFFEKILASDVFVVYDTAQFSRDGFQQRNSILLNGTKVLCSLSVGTADAWHLPLKDVPIKDDRKTRAIWATLCQAYQKAPYFQLYRPRFEPLFLGHPTNLCDFSLQIIEVVLQILGWTGRIVRTSTLNLDLTKRKSEALLEIVQAVGGTVYLSGSSGKSYLNEQIFRDAGVEVLYQAFHPHPYPQRSEAFVPNLPILDFLFNAPVSSLQFEYKFHRKEDLGVGASTEVSIGRGLLTEEVEEA
jgi:hypothetical protein